MVLAGMVGVGEFEAGPSKKKEEVLKRREYRKGQTLKKYTKIMNMLDNGLKISEIH